MVKNIHLFLVRAGLLAAIGLAVSASAAQASTLPAAPKDSTGLERKNGKVLVLYKVEAGETLFAIARKYRTTVADVQKLNPGMASAVKKGQIVRVPPLSLITVLAGNSPNYRQPPAQAGAEVEKIHTVKAGETLFAISRQYKVSVADLKAMNKLESTSLHEGQQLVVSKNGGEATAKSDPKADSKKEYTLPPAPKGEGGVSMTKSPEPAKEPAKEEPKKETAAPKPSLPEPAKAAKTEPKAVPAQENPAQQTGARAGYVKHTVKPGETLYAIAKMYNGDVKQIEQENKLAGGQVATGQVLDVRQGPPMEEKPAVGLANAVDNAKGAPADSAALETSTATNNTMGYERIVEHGIAEVVDNEAGARNYFCLHRSAPVGKIVQIKNEMNGATIYARVIGKLPETGNNDKVTVKISRKAFEKLSAADKRFPVEISYPAQ